MSLIKPWADVPGFMVLAFSEPAGHLELTVPSGEPAFRELLQPAQGFSFGCFPAPTLSPSLIPWSRSRERLERLATTVSGPAIARVGIYLAIVHGGVRH